MLCTAHRIVRRPAPPLAFSLLEVLVVVSLIAMLLGMMAPSLKAARERAKQVVCGIRLKQWSLAFKCYATEHRGMWPHCDGLDRGPRELDDPFISREDLADWHGWLDVLPPMIDLTPWRDHPRGGRPDHSTFFQCPAARPMTVKGVYSYDPVRDGYFSYAMNSCLELDRNAWPPPDNIGYPMPSFLDSGRIASPQRVIVLFDQLLDPRGGFDEHKLYRGAGKHSGSYPKSFSARHRHGQSGLGGNLLFADGHSDWRQSVWKEEWDLEQELPPRDDPEWYPYPVAGMRLSKSKD